jgi:hypothetical protein
MDDFENAGNLTLTELTFFPTVEFCRTIWGTDTEYGTLSLLVDVPIFFTTTEYYTAPTTHTAPGFLMLSTDCNPEIVSGATVTAPALIETSATLPGLIQSIKGKIKSGKTHKGISFVNTDSTIALFGSPDTIAPSQKSLEKLTLKIFNTSSDWYLGLASFPDMTITSTPDSLKSISENDIFSVVQSSSPDIFNHSVLVGTDIATVACYAQYNNTNISISYIQSDACYQANFSNASFVGGKSDILGDVLFLFSVNDDNDSIVSHAAQFTAPMLLRGMDSESTNKDVLEYNNFDIEVKFGWREIIII